jgi:hypothetical protein
VQNEYSLWTRNPEIAMLDACRDLGTALVAFSPVARGFLCGEIDLDTLAANDFRRGLPRFAPEHHAANVKLLVPFQTMANEQGCTPAQLAIAWLLHRGDHILPIPGTRSVEHLTDNIGAASVRLSPAVVQQLDELINQNTVAGNRYTDQANREVDTENF